MDAPPTQAPPPTDQRHVVLFDGQCGLCNRFNRLVIDRDPHQQFAFAPLQGPSARELLAPHGLAPDDLTTLYVVSREPGGERVLARSDAALFVLARLRGSARVLAWLRFLPRGLRDRAYDLLARHRYRLLGRHDRCPRPDADELQRFLEA